MSSLLSLAYSVACLSRTGTASIENNQIAVLMLLKELIKFIPFTCPGVLILTLVKCSLYNFCSYSNLNAGVCSHYIFYQVDGILSPFCSH